MASNAIKCFHSLHFAAMNFKFFTVVITYVFDEMFSLNEMNDTDGFSSGLKRRFTFDLLCYSAQVQWNGNVID